MLTHLGHVVCFLITVMKKRYRNGEFWDFEREMEISGVGMSRQVILGLDGGTTSTVCICMPFVPFTDEMPDPLPVLARAVAGCSNHNSVGGMQLIIVYVLSCFVYPFELMFDNCWFWFVFLFVNLSISCCEI